MPGHGVVVGGWVAAKAGTWRGGRVFPGKTCAPLAPLRGRAGVGQAEGMEQQEKGISPEGASGVMPDDSSPPQEHAQLLLTSECGLREARMQNLCSVTFLAETSDGAGHRAAKLVC